MLGASMFVPGNFRFAISMKPNTSSFGRMLWAVRVPTPAVLAMVGVAISKLLDCASLASSHNAS